MSRKNGRNPYNYYYDYQRGVHKSSDTERQVGVHYKDATACTYNYL